jgi:hypothetical protein
VIVTVFTWHAARCPHKNNRYYKRCNCRKWLYVEGSRKPFSAKTRSWAEAEKKSDELKRKHEEQRRADDKPDSNPTLKPATMRQAR